MPDAMSAKSGNWDESITQEIELAPNLGAARQAMTLQVVRGPRVGATYTVDHGDLILGRGAQADVQVGDDSMSRMHARFTRSGDALIVSDMGSLNGTYVEGQQIRRPTQLKQGDRVRLGNLLLRFMVQEPQELRASQSLYESAVRDHLTGLYNRGHFMEQLGAEMALARRHDTPFSLLLIDVDHFKAVNDTHGHPVGDRMLRAIADRVRETLRREDVGARIGGEELAVLLRATGGEEAETMAQRLRKRCGQAAVFVAGYGPVRVTVSVGIAANLGDRPYADMEEIMAAADEALYDAKRGGRNRVVRHEPDEHTLVRINPRL